MLLKDPVIPPEGYDRCGRCNQLVRKENMRTWGEFDELYGPGCYRWLRHATEEEIRLDAVKRPLV